VSLGPGDVLLHYRLVDKLGEGGMGVVWRAQDSTLGRDVAIKILPPEFAADPERLARFDREAKVLASLNHPNIASIYGFHEAGGVRFLAMELVPGEGLDQRISRGPIPVDEAKAIALKIAEALEYAHERGIVHRDLKPANIRVTPDGTVKVLDFGLAKAIVGEMSGSGPTSTPTILPTVTSAGTAIGMILGTAAYMSPEQARGRAVDRRADIWAFGVVAVEMLTGKRLFDGETVSDTIAGVLTRPLELDALAYASLWKRCLERDPKLRLRDIGEARIALERPAELASTTQPSARGPWPLVAGALLVAGLAAGWFLKPAPAAKPDDARYALAIPDGLTLSTAEQPQVAISADGKLQVAVVADAKLQTKLLLRSEDAFEAKVLADTERATAPFFSPDGVWIAFYRDGALFKIPVAGGPPVRLANAVGQPRGGAWGRDGFLYIAPDTISPIQRVSQDGGTPEAVTKLDAARSERTHRWPTPLPDASAVLFTSDDEGSTEYYDDARIVAVRPATGERKVLIEGSSMARYAATGHLIFARGGNLFAVRFDPKTLTTSGSPFPVVAGVATDVSTGAVDFALSESGAAAWIPAPANTALKQVWVDRRGVESAVAIPVAPYNELALSPDGRRVALTGGQGGVADLWVFDLERVTMTRLTIDQNVARPVWSPDGTRIAYGVRVQGAASKGNTWHLAWRLADGSQAEEVLLERERATSPSGFTPDGRNLIFDAFDVGTQYRKVMLLPLGGPREPRVLMSGSFSIYSATVSPDGRWIAYVSSEGGQPGVFVRPFPSGEGRWQISTPQGYEPRWSSDGRELFYRAEGVLQVVKLDTTRGFTAGRPERLFDGVATAGIVHSYGPSPDGSRIFTSRLPEGQGGQRTVFLDRGFAGRLVAETKP
jgi:serine/threonine-protein kinase